MSSQTIRFTVSVPEEIHRELRLLAAARNASLNDLVQEGLQLLLDKGQADLKQFVEAWQRGREGRGLWEMDRSQPASADTNKKSNRKSKKSAD